MLTVDRITDTALEILSDFGLGDLSMRRLARELEVQPSALYWHVKNKQEVFVLIARRIASETERALSVRAATAGEHSEAAAASAAHSVQSWEVFLSTLLSYREGAEIFMLAYSQSGAEVVPASLKDSSDGALSPAQVSALEFTLGHAMVKQNRTLLASLAPGDAATDRYAASQASTTAGSAREFATAIQALLNRTI